MSDNFSPMAISCDLLISNGTAVLPDSKSGELSEQKLDVAISGGKIVAIGDSATGATAKENFNALGLHVLPGLIDTQVHFREPGFPLKEDLSSGTRSALLGGVTGVFEMPNTSPPTLTAKDLTDKLERANGRSWCNYAFYLGADLSNYKDLHKIENSAGCPGIKIFLGSSTGHLVLEDEQALQHVLRTCKRRIAFHAEDEQRLNERRHLVDENPGQVALHAEWRDAEVAFRATRRIVMLAKEMRHPIHILHVTSKQEIEFLKDYRDFVSVETTPQHLTLSAPECYEKLGTLAQMNPPIRTKEHKEALWKGLKLGHVDVLGSDHAPHTLEEKKKPYPASPSGLTGVQTIVPLMLDHISQGHLAITDLVRLMGENPRQLFKIKNKGRIEIGGDADITIVDLKKQVTIKNEWIASRCGWTPYDGMKVTGWPVTTILGGQIVMRDDKVLGQPSGRPMEFQLDS